MGGCFWFVVGKKRVSSSCRAAVAAVCLPAPIYQGQRGSIAIEWMGLTCSEAIVLNTEHTHDVLYAENITEHY